MGVIPSTGWDSFTISSLEIASCGLPLIVSNLKGLSEAVQDGETGYLFEKGNYKDLSEKIIKILYNTELHKYMSAKTRKRILENFTLRHQENRIRQKIIQLSEIYL